jgi:hypothetical protein
MRSAKENPEKKTRTHVDTIVFTRAEAEAWKSPPFQRPLRMNTKALAIVDEIKKSEGVIPGVITLGKLKNLTFLLDGQHRRQAFLLSGLDAGYADVRIHEFDEMGEMGEEFVRLNTQLVRLRPDDILRGMEGSSDAIAHIRGKCPFVGYDMIRRGDRSPILGMSLLLRLWMSSANETPTGGGASTMELVSLLTLEEAQECAKFVTILYEAWGRSEDSRRLWTGLNLVLCAWLFRRCVLAPPHLVSSAKRWTKMTRDEFRICMMALAADPTYSDWLTGRALTERNRSPAYHRMKNIVAIRLRDHRKQPGKPLLPQPAWDIAGGGGSSGSRGR